MPTRRHLLGTALGLALAGKAPRVTAAPLRHRYGASSHSQGSIVVIVRRPDGAEIALDPRTGDPVAVPSASPAAETPACPALPPTARIAAGQARYRQQWSAVGAQLLLAGTGDAARWWYWRDAVAARTLDLPPTLEPALPTGACARWFHGATVDAAALGSGTQRFVAVDLATGVTVLDRTVARRLELVATAVSADGAAIARLQGGNTRLDLWLADLRGTGSEGELAIPITPAPAAPSAIDLRVHVDADGAFAIAGVGWSQPDHPAPFVVLATLTVATTSLATVPGTLVAVAHAR